MSLVVGAPIMIVTYRDGGWRDYCIASIFHSHVATVGDAPETIVTATGVRPDGATFARVGLRGSSANKSPREGDFAYRGLTK